MTKEPKEREIPTLDSSKAPHLLESKKSIIQEEEEEEAAENKGLKDPFKIIFFFLPSIYLFW